MIKDSDVILINTDFFVTESTVISKLPIDKVEAWVRQQKKTGQLIHHVSQGGIQKIGLREQTKIPEEKREAIRKLLDV